jgi:hypothetical protein
MTNILPKKVFDIRYRNAVDDADLLIAQTAVDCSLSSEVIVIGEDTDLLVLLIHHVGGKLFTCTDVFPVITLTVNFLQRRMSSPSSGSPP